VEPLGDLHQMDPDAFREHTRSFEFWFGAVEGYLKDRYFGLSADTRDQPLDPGEADRLVTVLCNYCVGETIALEGAGTLIQIAPNRACKIFLATQTVDEARHLEVLIHRLAELGVTDPEAEIERRASPNLLAFKKELLRLVRGRDWEAALFAQNVILEAMEFSVFHHHASSADPRTAELLHGIVKDERRHIGFGENEIGRRLASSPETRQRLSAVRETLDPLVLGAFEETARELQTTRDARGELTRSYLNAVERLGFA